MIYKILFKIYKNSFSFVLEHLWGKGCIYNPTCSKYARMSLEKHGFIKGTIHSIKRALRCHPFYKGNLYDPVK